MFFCVRPEVVLMRGRTSRSSNANVTFEERSVGSNQWGGINVVDPSGKVKEHFRMQFHFP